MLEQILDHIHNYFEKEVVTGSFTVSGGTAQFSFLQNGQYYKIEGSVFNDGIHQYPSTDLIDESFDGIVTAMAVPPAVIALSNEIETWVNDNKSVIESPYTSESFGGYSYSKASGTGANGGSLGWQDMFRSRLNRWRKI